jgi:hypothetical protein
MLYGLACWAVYRRIKQSMSIAEMRMLRRLMSGVSKKDRLINEYERVSFKCSVNNGQYERK